MVGKRFWSITLPLISLLVLVAAAGASTLAVTANSATPGTAAASQPRTLTLTLAQISYGANGRPTQSLVGVDEQLAPEFEDKLALFGTCDPADFQKLGSDPPPCPGTSLLGTSSFTAYVPSLLLTATADGYIYRTGPNQVEAWVHISKPAQFSVALPGTVTAGSTTVGPTVDWNLSAAVNLGVTADVTTFQTVWTTARVAVTTTTKQLKPKPRKSKKKKPSRHRRHKPANRAQDDRGSSRSSQASATTTEAASAFESAGCPGSGNWSFAATLRYAKGSPETVTATVACGSVPVTTLTTTTTTTTACTELLGICLPALRQPSLVAAAPRMPRVHIIS